jgi:hypothetical protein
MFKYLPHTIYGIYNKYGMSTCDMQSNVEHNSKVVGGGIFGTKIVTYIPLSDAVSGYRDYS